MTEEHQFWWKKRSFLQIRFNMIVWFSWPQFFDLPPNPINFTWVVCTRGCQGQILVMQNDKGVSIKYLQEAWRAFQYRANSNISAHALSWKRKADATICGKDKSAQRNSTVFIKPSRSKSEGKQSMNIFSFFFKCRWCVFFRALPELPNPPPHDPNSGNLVLFFRKSKFKTWKSV